MLDAAPTGDSRVMDPLRNELVRRQERRYRRRWLRRWRRRRLLLHLVAVERDLRDDLGDGPRELHDHEIERIAARLSRNAKGLFR